MVGSDLPIVIRKLCVALVAVFKQAGGEWNLCIPSVVQSFVAGSPVLLPEYHQKEFASYITCLSEQQTISSLWFAVALIEEVSKVDSTSAKR